MSLSVGLQRGLAVCLGRGPSLSKHKYLKLLQLIYILLERNSYESGLGLLVKPQHQVLYHLPFMSGEV